MNKMNAMVLETSSASKLLLGVSFITILVPLFGRLLLHEGLCHADPHPGNFKLEPNRNKSGRHTMWILDWGGVLEVTTRKKLSLCRVILACYHHHKIGVLSKNKNILAKNLELC